MHVFADLPGGGQFVVLGFMLVLVAVILRRAAPRLPRRPARDAVYDLQDEIREIETGHASRLEKMELRLHDFARDVEARIQTRLTLLDELVFDADQEIARLQQLLEQTRGGPQLVKPFGPDSTTRARAAVPAADESSAAEMTAGGDDRQKARIYALADAGLTAKDIADQTGQPLARVILCLNLRSAARWTDAA